VQLLPCWMCVKQQAVGGVASGPRLIDGHYIQVFVVHLPANVAACGSCSMRTELAVTGRTRRCLNLGSYNYLGFAAADEYCTPRVLDTLGEWGMSTCSSRTEGGGWQC